MKKYLIIGGIGLVFVLIIGLVFIISFSKEAKGLATSSFMKYATDVVGTKTGTTTAGVIFGSAVDTGNVATTTYITKIGGLIDTAVYTFKIMNASTTPAGSAANLHLSVLFSNDDYCESATTTTIYDVVTKGQVNWFDAAPFLDMHAAQSLIVGTSSLIWNTSGKKGQGQPILLTNLVAECLALQVNGSSTELWAQIRTK